jgi:peptide/nickel transport system ATP-binding protein
VRAVNDVSLDVQRSKVLGIAGESGSGKSTLVYAMTRLLRAPGVISRRRQRETQPRQGREGNEHLGRPVKASEKELRKIRWSQVSIVLQSALSALNPVLRISKEFEEVFKTHRPGHEEGERRERAVELLSMVGSTRTAWSATPTNSPAGNASAS